MQEVPKKGDALTPVEEWNAIKCTRRRRLFWLLRPRLAFIFVNQRNLRREGIASWLWYHISSVQMRMVHAPISQCNKVNYWEVIPTCFVTHLTRYTIQSLIVDRRWISKGYFVGKSMKYSLMKLIELGWLGGTINDYIVNNIKIRSMQVWSCTIDWSLEMQYATLSSVVSCAIKRTFECTQNLNFSLTMFTKYYKGCCIDEYRSYTALGLGYNYSLSSTESITSKCNVVL